ncbi:MAG: ABC transporter permease, partial [Alphaproteobacteria bacterium]|nr:ABC transporter permease [Alphaproteobacteria bacterium]
MAGASSRSGMSAALTLIGKRFASSLLTLLLVSMTIFVIAQLLPGDAAQEALGQSATPEQVAALRHEMGLDRPAHVRYVSWLGGMLTGDPGQSMVANMPVGEVIEERLPNSLLLAALAAMVAIPVALSIGIGSAMNRGGRIDRALNVVTLAMVAVPEFLVATIAVLIFSVKLRWLPSIALASSDMEWGEYLRGVAMPVLTLCVIVIAQMARMTRAAVIDQMDRPYVEMAVLKGVAPVRVVLKHIMPNAIAPIVNAMAL